MSGHHSFSRLRDQVLSRPGGAEAMAKARAETMEEIRLYELRRAEAMRQIDETGRLEITPAVVADLEHAEDVRVSTLADHLEALGARLELVAIFDDEDRRVPVHLRTEPAT
jgi:hypothetical protein